MMHMNVWFTVLSVNAVVVFAELDIEDVARWTEVAYARMQNVDCVVATSQATSLTTTTHDCRRLQATMADGRQNIVVYAAGYRYDVTAYQQHHRGYRRVKAVLPDGVLEDAVAGSSSTAAKTGHDAVLVLDPYPMASYGHLVLVFYVDYSWDSIQCRLLGGTFFADRGECLSMATKQRCRNLLEHSSDAHRCEILFLPLVHLAREPAHRDDQLLECIPIPGYSWCPQLRAKNETLHLVCNPIHANTHRCDDAPMSPSSSASGGAAAESLQHPIVVHTSCRPFETCDHAVLVGGGGWSREHSGVRPALNVRHVFQMLRHNGFHRKNIKVFYANGARGVQLVGEKTHFVYPSALKLALRHHVQKICRSTFCADSFVVYLNNPTRSDGVMLLWDSDGNGQAEDDEVYRVTELLVDLDNCTANQVYVLVDQSFAGGLVKAFDDSDRHSNVVVFGSGRKDEYSFDGEFTRHWCSLRNHSRCIKDVHQSSHAAVRLSHPTMHDGSDDTIRATIFGAPCDVRPPFNQKELRQKYLGCQNVPTKVWINKHFPTR